MFFDRDDEDMPKALLPHRHCGSSANLETTVKEYLKAHTEVEIDMSLDNKLLISGALNDYFKRIK